VLRRHQRGDTLIEVLFAVSVFSFIVVTALILMNQGTAASQRALDITLVRQQIDAQAETLRFMHDSYVAQYHPGIEFDYTDTFDGTEATELKTSPAEEWSKMVESIVATDNKAASEFGTCPETPSGRPSEGSFIIDTRHVKFIEDAEFYGPAETSSEITYNDEDNFVGARGLWIEAVRSAQSADTDQSNTGYIDFHLRACWDSPGQNVPMTLGTIVRLYEPRN
jgi:type II secretory pathway pseudopilin PulG